MFTPTKQEIEQAKANHRHKSDYVNKLARQYRCTASDIRIGFSLAGVSMYSKEYKKTSPKKIVTEDMWQYILYLQSLGYLQLEIAKACGISTTALSREFIVRGIKWQHVVKDAPQYKLGWQNEIQ